MINNYHNLATKWAGNNLPGYFWISLGIFQIFLAFGLFLPSLFRRFSKITTISAIGLALISLLGIGLYASYSGFPGLFWGLIPALLAMFIAYQNQRLNKL